MLKQQLGIHGIPLRRWRTYCHTTSKPVHVKKTENILFLNPLRKFR